MLKTAPFGREDVAGAIIFCCAGTLLALETAEVQQMISKVGEVLNHRPIIGTFSFGEQGRFINGKLGHGNLMFSLILISNCSKKF